jgi:predicted RNase H-like HicB family nuclease
MKYVYPVLFENEDDKVLVSVPDLRGCFTFGNDLIDAMEMAVDAMSMWLATAEDRGWNLARANKPSRCSCGEWLCQHGACRYRCVAKYPRYSSWCSCQCTDCRGLKGWPCNYMAAL